MEPLIVVGALVAAGYILTTSEQPVYKDRSKTLVDYYVQGGTLEDALASGYRLVEVHVYSDGQDEPVVSLKQPYDGATARTFESCCTSILQKAFPNDDPLILSIVLHTEKSFTANRVAYHLKTTLRHQLFNGSIEDKPLESLANKLIIVSGNEARGTNLEPMVNLSWNDSHLRRLSYQQAAHPREEDELRSFTHSHIALVAPDQAFSRFKVMDDVYAFGCQWNLCPTPLGRPGFISRES